MVYGVLAEEMTNKIHALALHTYTQTEWEQRQEYAPESPECRDGSKQG